MPRKNRWVLLVVLALVVAFVAYFLYVRQTTAPIG